MKETWNPAEISEDIKPVNYVNADSWNAAELNEAINLFGINYPIDTWNPAELDEKARNIISDITSIKTITGNPISFKTINGGYVKSCEVTFSPIQSGSGDPSPENVRPISGRDSLHLYQDTEQTETPETTKTATFPDTVYGGKYDFVEGGLKKTISDILDLGTITWAKTTPGGKTFFYATVTGKKIGYDAQLVCSQYKQYNAYFSGMGDCQISGNASFSYIYIRDDSKANLTVEEFKTAMNGVQLCYELATPTTTTLASQSIPLLKGNNTLWTDGDSIELKYTKLALPEDPEDLSLNQKVKKAIEIIKGKEIKEETKKSTTKGRRKKS